MDRDERIGAYVDGELSPSDREAFEREMAADAALASATAAHRRLRERLALTYDPVLEEPTPLGLRLAAQTANQGRARWGPPVWAGMAACLLAGVLVGRALLPPAGPLATRDGALVARGALARALDGQLASESGPVRIGVSFKSLDGRYCRTFQSAPDRLAGLACRDGDAWQARVLASWTPAARDAYRTAGSETPAAVLAAVDAAISGDPLDAAQERAARGRDWKP
jgi:hypothetical protein